MGEEIFTEKNTKPDYASTDELSFHPPGNSTRNCVERQQKWRHPQLLFFVHVYVSYCTLHLLFVDSLARAETSLFHKKSLFFIKFGWKRT
jgi:hypothetical protein